MKIKIVIALLILTFLLTACEESSSKPANSQSTSKETNDIYIELNNNIPSFTDKELEASAYEYYSPLDSLGRCGQCIAMLNKDMMPKNERGDISNIKPSGWQTVKYRGIIEDDYLYNRCHLIGWQLSGENDNPLNLITGTRDFNIEGMLIFENKVASYIRRTNNHVLYRVTPVFEGDNLIAKGVQIEAKSVEDNGAGICFNVFIYNSQPQIGIDYATGNSWLIKDESNMIGEYILNISSKKIHFKDCKGAADISDKNKEEYTGNIEDLFKKGYTKCGICSPY